VFYVVDSNYRKSVDLQKWYNDWEKKGLHLDLPTFGHNPSDNVALECTRWVAQNVKYVGDVELWQAQEKWALPHETLERGRGDCDDGALVLYALLRKHGFSDDQVRVVAGNVRGGGHCYVTYNSFEDGVEYALDWCYWPLDSLMVPYGLNSNYNCGRTEWFAFNSSGAYVRR
jgi:hypothetical protein